MNFVKDTPIAAPAPPSLIHINTDDMAKSLFGNVSSKGSTASAVSSSFCTDVESVQRENIKLLYSALAQEEVAHAFWYQQQIAFDTGMKAGLLQILEKAQLTQGPTTLLQSKQPPRLGDDARGTIQTTKQSSDAAIFNRLLEARKAQALNSAVHRISQMKYGLDSSRQNDSLLTFLKKIDHVTYTTSANQNASHAGMTQLLQQQRNDNKGPSAALKGVQMMPNEDKSCLPSKRKGRPSMFPKKLHQMLSDLEKWPGGMEIASFTPKGHAFKIHNEEEFAEKVIPMYFHMTSLASFQRQLRMYGFRQCHTGNDRGAYFHKFFIRGQASLCERIKRV